MPETAFAACAGSLFVMILFLWSSFNFYTRQIYHDETGQTNPSARRKTHRQTEQAHATELVMFTEKRLWHPVGDSNPCCRRERVIIKGNTVGFLRVLADTNCYKMPWGAVKAYPICIQSFPLKICDLVRWQFNPPQPELYILTDGVVLIIPLTAPVTRTRKCTSEPNFHSIYIL